MTLSLRETLILANAIIEANSNTPDTQDTSDTDSTSTEEKSNQKVKTHREKTVFSHDQLAGLEAHFKMKQYITLRDRRILGEQLHLTPEQVRVWFQNRRNRYKKSLRVQAPKVPRNRSNGSSTVPRIPVTATAYISYVPLPPSTSPPLTLQTYDIETTLALLEELFKVQNT